MTERIQLLTLLWRQNPVNATSAAQPPHQFTRNHIAAVIFTLRAEDALSEETKAYAHHALYQKTTQN